MHDSHTAGLCLIVLIFFVLGVQVVCDSLLCVEFPLVLGGGEVIFDMISGEDVDHIGYKLRILQFNPLLALGEILPELEIHIVVPGTFEKSPLGAFLFAGQEHLKL